MPAGSEALTRARREEIVNACAELYRTMGFREITLNDIGKRTSFTRTSIYNYFHTKEEIFLALLEREHEAWIADMEAIERENEALSAEAFADAFAQALSRRMCMLKLMCMNLYDMEGNSRMENLVSFKRAYARARETVARCLRKFFPQMGERGEQAFLGVLFPFLFGIYPYTTATDKQREAMARAGRAVRSLYGIRHRAGAHRPAAARDAAGRRAPRRKKTCTVKLARRRALQPEREPVYTRANYP